MMRAVVYKRYGPPDVLRLEQLPLPAPGDNEVLVKVHAASINSWDWDLIRGVPFVNRLMAGLTKPKRIQILGCDIAGTVEATGKYVKLFKPGDEVFGDLSRCGWGGFAEFVCARDNALVLKPASITFEQAAAIPQAGLLALQGLCDKGRIQAGQKVLINGAGGGAGSFAIQIARYFKAYVTGVDSSSKLSQMRSLGAHQVIDYTQEDFTRGDQRYDLILDVSGYHSIFDYSRVLNHGGVYVMMGGSSALVNQLMFLGPWFSVIGKKKMGLLLHKPNKGLDVMIQLVESGNVVPVIDRCYPLSELAEAFRYFGEGHVNGKIVITTGA
jgi:NADPH:quinone reductase-like Zn-dependent oxidoreductase